jgi:hypothetical protein
MQELDKSGLSVAEEEALAAAAVVMAVTVTRTKPLQRQYW